MNDVVETKEEKTVLQGLVEEAKKEGLDIAEDSAKKAVEFLFVAIPKLVVMIKNPTVQMLVSIVVTSLMALKPKVFEILDKIDGEIE